MPISGHMVGVVEICEKFILLRENTETEHNRLDCAPTER